MEPEILGAGHKEAKEKWSLRNWLGGGGDMI